jgi:soluble lytic murein transglycosylase
VLIGSLLFVCSCATQAQENNYFYLGLINDSNAEKVRLFEKALDSPNVHARNAAANELAALMSHGTELSAKTKDRIRNEASLWWASAFDIISPTAPSANVPNKDRALSFLLSFEQNSFLSFSEARHYVLQKCAGHGNFFTSNEMAAIEGHYAVARLRYNDALNFFRAFRVNGNWPAQMPAIFIEYPNLINDLGRAFQFTQSGNEGLNLFLQWEANLAGNITAADDLRYRLLFFAARIARRMGQNAQAITLFERALSLAPDYEQQDACIWYIYDMSLTGPLNIIFDRIEQYVPKWHNGSSYNNVLERFLHRLVYSRDWRRIIGTYDLIKDVNGASIKAGYAWIIARTFEEGYLTADDRRLASRAANVESADALTFMRLAYDASDVLFMPAFYYRKQSANALGLPFLIFPEAPVSGNEEQSPALQFLLGFFSHNAERFAFPYIRSMERNLNPDELRAVARALDNAHMHPQSMGVVSRYIGREGYRGNRRDLELMYPRPYLELIERNADYFDIEPSLLFGLIRTESAFQSAVVSRAGAVGLSQLMPATAREQAERIRRGGGPDFFCEDDNIDSTNPDLNVYIGSFYYNHLLSRFDNNAQLALMSYNGGQTRVRRWRNASNLPVDLFVETVVIFETRDYGRRVPAISRIYEYLYYR